MGLFTTLEAVKEELNYPTSTTNFDSSLTNLISYADQYFVMRMQRYTSLPVNSDIAAQIGQIQIRWIAYRFKQRNASTAQYAELQTYIGQVEMELIQFLKQNFRTTFDTVGSQDNIVPFQNYLGRPVPWWSSDDSWTL